MVTDRGIIYLASMRNGLGVGYWKDLSRSRLFGVWTRIQIRVFKMTQNKKAYYKKIINFLYQKKIEIYLLEASMNDSKLQGRPPVLQRGRLLFKT
jgi:hypothetical protein